MHAENLILENAMHYKIIAPCPFFTISLAVQTEQSLCLHHRYPSLPSIFFFFFLPVEIKNWRKPGIDTKNRKKCCEK
jgi:hypothetical protein